jgi:hypothetical protein
MSELRSRMRAESLRADDIRPPLRSVTLARAAWGVRRLERRRRGYYHTKWRTEVRSICRRDRFHITRSLAICVPSSDFNLFFFLKRRLLLGNWHFNEFCGELQNTARQCPARFVRR